MRIFTIAGPGLSRGLDYGREQAAEIAATAAELKTRLASAGHPPGPIGHRLTTSTMARRAEELTPDLWEEVRAIASASRLPLDDILLLVFRTEVEAMTARATGCSTLALVMPGRPGRGDPGGLDDDARPPTPPTTEIGQTVDLPDWLSGRMRVLRIGTHGVPSALVMAYPGSLGLCGANEAGLGVAVNALPRAPWSDEGLGVAFIVRQLLTLGTLAQAEAFLTSVPHAIGQAFTIAAPDGIATFEADPDGVRRVTAPGIPAIAHTDHSVEADEGASPSSLARLEILLSCLARRDPVADALTGQVVLDGTAFDDPCVTFGAFRAVGSESTARFIDGADLRSGRREWSRFSYV